MDGTIQGKIIFGAITPTTFTINNVATRDNVNSININNSNFSNGSTPSLTSTYLGYSVPFTMTNVSQGVSLLVTAGGPNTNSPTVSCLPEIDCKFSQADSLRVELKGSFS